MKYKLLLIFTFLLAHLSGFAQFPWNDNGNTLVSGNEYIGTNSNHAFLMYTGGTEKMRLTTGGFLGIGISVPANYVQIHDSANGGAGVHQSFTNGTTGPTGSDGFRIGIVNTGAAQLRLYEDLPMQFFTNNTSRGNLTTSIIGGTAYTRLGINAGTTMITNPRSVLHLGYNYLV